MQVVKQRELFLRPGQPAASLELRPQYVAQLGQEAGVRCRVLEHRGRERPCGPVGALKTLVEPDAEVLLEQGCEPYSRLVEELCGDAGVEQP